MFFPSRVPKLGKKSNRSYSLYHYLAVIENHVKIDPATPEINRNKQTKRHTKKILIDS